MIHENYERFIEEYLNKGLLKEQKSNYRTSETLILRALKDLKTSKANLDIDEGTAHAIAYLAMLCAGRAFILLRGFVLLMDNNIRRLRSLLMLSEYIVRRGKRQSQFKL